MSPKNSTLLVVDDDTAHRTMLTALLKGWGYTIHEADDGQTAIDMAKERYYDLILMDIRMINVSGLEAMDTIKSWNPSIPIVIMTAYSSIETAVDALKNGAYDYMTKPIDFEKLKITILRATEHVELQKENQKLRLSLEDRFDRHKIIGKSPVMIKLLETIAQVAPSEASVLITGESGTGKELVAGATHYNSPRKQSPFVKINCAAITDSLLESELFGHEKGSFTGAHQQKEGKFVQAEGGSIFLDEVSEMPLSMQVKLLRVLQEREVTRVGGDEIIKVDVRVIAATNKNLTELITQGRFREDLYYRLNVVDLYLPPLRERQEDIPLIAQKFLDDFAEKNNKPLKGFTPETMDILIKHDWPGNVRELMNAVERGVVMSRGDYLEPDNIHLYGKKDDTAPDSHSGNISGIGNTTLEEIEKNVIIETLRASENNKSETARRLGITRKTLHKKLKKIGLMS